MDATLEQSRSLHATILHQGCTLSKVHSSVITPLKKKRLEKEAVGAWNRKGDDGVKILSEQTLAGSAFPGAECVLIHQRGQASWVRVPAQLCSLRHPGLCCLSFPCGTRTLRLLWGKTPSILGALRGSLPTEPCWERGLGDVCMAFCFHFCIYLCTGTSACLFGGL